MTDLSLRNAATTVAKQIEQTIPQVHCSLVWNNTDANRLGFRLPGPHTVGFLLRTYYSDGDEVKQLIPLSKDVIKRPSNWPQCLLTVTKCWLAALENEQERLRPSSKPAAPPQWPMVTCVACNGRLLRDLVILGQITHCPNCGAAYPDLAQQLKRGNDE